MNKNNAAFHRLISSLDETRYTALSRMCSYYGNEAAYEVIRALFKNTPSLDEVLCWLWENIEWDRKKVILRPYTEKALFTLYAISYDMSFCPSAQRDILKEGFNDWVVKYMIPPDYTDDEIEPAKQALSNLLTLCGYEGVQYDPSEVY